MTMSTERLAELRISTRRDHDHRCFDLLTQLVEESLRPSYRKVFQALPRHTSYAKTGQLAKQLNMSTHVVSTALCALARMGLVRRAVREAHPSDGGNWWRRDSYHDVS